MTDLTVSVVIVSRGRPDALKRCLIGVEQLQYDPFEVVVVADPEGAREARSLPFSSHLKIVEYDEANISAARNLGIVQAAGDVVAFIDDDAVPEPQWLRYLVAPAAQSDVAAMGGYVRGRNGISFQWTARSLDEWGEAHDLTLDGDQASVLHPPKGRAIKTEGTNMAFRRDVLVELGGFDDAYHYFLDETDLNMRLARAGHATAIVPLAEVHHGFEANASRTRTRVPTDLFDIGASWAVFQRKHIAPGDHATQWHRLRREQRQRVLTHMISGGLEPRDVRRLMKRLDEGYAAGEDREIGRVTLPSHPAAPFQRFPSTPRPSTLLPTRPIRAESTLQEARQRVKNAEIVTVLSLSPTAMFHHVKFGTDGVWLQKGGIFGRSDRIQPLFRITSRSRRVQKERARVARQRGLSEN